MHWIWGRGLASSYFAESQVPQGHFTGLEIQEESAALARRSVAYNGLDADISIETGDIREAAKTFGASSFDVVTTKPALYDRKSWSRRGKHGKDHCPPRNPLHTGGCDLPGSLCSGAEREILHGTQAISSGGNYVNHGKIQD